MYIDFNLILLFKLFLPPLLYVVILYLITPHYKLKLSTILLCFFAGILSTNLVQIHYALINMSNLTIFEECFYSIAPREEICKFLSYLGVILILKKQRFNPVSLMVNMGVVGLGFATFENFFYAMNYGENILMTRSFTATLAHLIFGLFIGYWVGLSKINIKKYEIVPTLTSVIHKYKKIKWVLYSLIGLVCAILFHGLWNYNLYISRGASLPIMVLMIIFGLWVSKFAFTDLSNQYRKSLGK